MLPTAPHGAEPGIQGHESQGQGKNRHRESDSHLGLGTPERLILFSLDLVPKGIFFCNPQFLSPFSVRFEAG